MQRPTQAEIAEALLYDPETGKFERKLGGRSIWPPDATGYIRISVNGTQWHAHRLAWVLVHGNWPEKGIEIDHINGDRMDNRIANLRLATRGQNATNSPAQKHSKTGLRGVHFHLGAGRYRAQIQKCGKMRSLGYFDSPQEAYSAYLTAAREVHGEFVRSP